jgi:transcription termination factor Rho
MLDEGTLEITPEGWGFLRRAAGQVDERDAYISQSQIQRFGLKPGDVIRGEVQPPRGEEGEKYYGLWKIGRSTAKLSNY